MNNTLSPAKIQGCNLHLDRKSFKNHLTRIMSITTLYSKIELNKRDQHNNVTRECFYVIKPSLLVTRHGHTYLTYSFLIEKTQKGDDETIRIVSIVFLRVIPLNKVVNTNTKAFSSYSSDYSRNNQSDFCSCRIISQGDSTTVSNS